MPDFANATQYAIASLAVAMSAPFAMTASGDAILDFTNNGPVAGVDPWKARLDITEASQGPTAR